jgi:gliding motility-associated-like protein
LLPNTISALINKPVICEGDSILLTTLYTGQDQNVLMNWQHCPTCLVNVPLQEKPTVTGYYYLTVLNTCAVSIIDSVNVIVNQNPKISLKSNLGEICPKELVQFNNLGDNSSSWTYEWLFGDGFTSNQTNPSHTYLSSGLYPVSLTVKNHNGCKTQSNDSSSVWVKEEAKADFTLQSFEKTYLDPTFNFTNLSYKAQNFSWYFGDNQTIFVTNPMHRYSEEGFYVVKLIANNDFNCPDSIQKEIEVKPSWAIYIPNTFTPDGSVFNDVFKVDGYGIFEDDFTFQLFNRWGELIFETNNLNEGWDGTQQKNNKVAQDGVYIWVVFFKDINDNKQRNEGHVNTLR